MVRVGLALAFFFLFLPGPATSSSPHWKTNHDELATGTWSVAAVDTDSREVGISLATCVPARLSVVRSRMARTGADPAPVYKITGAVGSGPAFELAHLVTGVGVVVAQGLVDRGNAERLAAASAQLVGGASPDAAIGAARADDRSFDERQYGIVTFRPSAANFTGNSASGWAGGSSIDVATVQGNFLVGARVVGAALEAFQEVTRQEEATLGDALMAALEAGSSQGGDKRCLEAQTALTAFLAVARPNDTDEIPHLWLAAPPQGTGRENPVSLLREAYDVLTEPSEGARAANDGGWGVWWTVITTGSIVIVLASSAIWLLRRRIRHP